MGFIDGLFLIFYNDKKYGFDKPNLRSAGSNLCDKFNLKKLLQKKASYEICFLGLTRGKQV
jgi:hypothetical protein